MIASKWFVNRAVRNELGTLRQQLEARQRAAAEAIGTRESWFKGAGLTFASGMIGFLHATPPTAPLDSRALSAMLTAAVAEGLTEVARDMKTRPFPVEVR
jgi:hypothetical protein